MIKHDTGCELPHCQTTAALSWSAATDNVSLQGYAIYVNGKYRATTKLTTFTVTGLAANTNYIISIRAYDRAKNFSGFSSELSASTLAP